MTNTRKRRIHFFDLKAIYYDSQDRNKEHVADVDPLFAKLQGLKYQRGGSESAIISIWGDEMLGAVDVPSTDFVAGRFLKMRRTGLPGVVSATGYRRVLLVDDEGLYEAAHFVYFRKSRIMAMEFNAYAPQARMFGLYLKRLAQAHHLQIDDLNLEVKVDPDTIARLRALGPITSIQASVASTQASTIRHAGGIAAALRGTAGVFKHAFNAEVVLSRERPRKDAPRGFSQEAKREVIELWTESGEVLTSLKVKVEPEDGGEPQLIDFKRDRFSAQLEIALTEGTLNTGDLFAKIVKYYEDSGIGGIGG